MKEHYKRPELEAWRGRIDDTENFDAFRWHQWVKRLDLANEDACKALNSATVKVGFIGFACDEGIRLNKGREGAALGPKTIRKELSNLPCLFTQNFELYDCGDIIYQERSLPETQHALSKAVSQMIGLGLFPIVIGGGHELAYGHYNGLKAHYEPLSILNFDAHLDIRPYDETTSSGTMFRQISDDCLAMGKSFNYMAVGLQKRGNTVELIKTAKARAVEMVWAADITQTDGAVAETKILAYAEQASHLYMTLCIDVIASAYAPGVSAAQPLGLHPERVVSFIKKAFRKGNVVAFDVAEVSPRFDHDNATANLASTFIFAIVNELAERAQCGIMI